MPSRLKRYHGFGHEHFVTFSCYQRLPYLNDDHSRTVFLETLEQLRLRHDFYVFGYVLMPDHIHLLLTPAEDVSIEKAMQYIKGGFSFHLKSPFDVWERSFKERRIKDEQDYLHHLRYIEQNPVRANLSPQSNSSTHPSHHNKSIPFPRISKVSFALSENSPNDNKTNKSTSGTQSQPLRQRIIREDSSPHSRKWGRYHQCRG